MQLVLCILKTAIKLWRIDLMYHQTKNIVKTVGIGLVAGTAVAVIGSQMMKSKNHNHQYKNMRRTACRAVRSVGNVVGGLEKMLK